MQAPWPYLTAKQAAKLLGTDRAMIRGLARQGMIEHVYVENTKGVKILLLSAASVEAIAARLALRDA